MPSARDPYRCSFCGKKQEQVTILIAGTGGVYICDQCIELASEEVARRRGQPPPPTTR